MSKEKTISKMSLEERKALLKVKEAIINIEEPPTDHMISSKVFTTIGSLLTYQFDCINWSFDSLTDNEKIILVNQQYFDELRQVFISGY